MFTGQRFNIDISDDEQEPEANANAPTAPNEEEDTSTSAAVPGLGHLDLIGGIKERDVSQVTVLPPTPPSSQSGGFPRHKDRKNATSAFRRRKAAAAAAAAAAGGKDGDRTPTPTGAPLNTRGNGTANAKALQEAKLREEKRSIDEENNKIIEALDAKALEEEREELLESMDTGLLEAFKNRSQRAGRRLAEDKKEEKSQGLEVDAQKKKSVSFDVPPETETEPEPAPEQKPNGAKGEQSSTETDWKEPPEFTGSPTLDPNSPSFLEDMKAHYFPDLPDNPRALSWMRPPSDPLSDSPADPESPYTTAAAAAATSLSPSRIRFSFRGDILPPTKSLSLPTTLGLHHHGHEPDAAGYTIRELALLSRSAVPTQRCIAWQVFGRILFKLGQGEFASNNNGNDEEGAEGEEDVLTEGLWKEIENHGIAAWMLAEANGSDVQEPLTTDENKNKNNNDGEPRSSYPLTASQRAYRFGKHASARSYALDAVWLWVKGGGIARGLNTKAMMNSADAEANARADEVARKRMREIAEARDRE